MPGIVLFSNAFPSTEQLAELLILQSGQLFYNYKIR